MLKSKDKIYNFRKTTVVKSQKARVEFTRRRKLEITKALNRDRTSLKSKLGILTLDLEKTRNAIALDLATHRISIDRYVQHNEDHHLREDHLTTSDQMSEDNKLSTASAIFTNEPVFVRLDNNPSPIRFESGFSAFMNSSDIDDITNVHNVDRALSSLASRRRNISPSRYIPNYTSTPRESVVDTKSKVVTNEINNKPTKLEARSPINSFHTEETDHVYHVFNADRVTQTDNTGCKSKTSQTYPDIDETGCQTDNVANMEEQLAAFGLAMEGSLEEIKRKMDTDYLSLQTKIGMQRVEFGTLHQNIESMKDISRTQLETLDERHKDIMSSNHTAMQSQCKGITQRHDRYIQEQSENNKKVTSRLRGVEERLCELIEILKPETRPFSQAGNYHEDPQGHMGNLEGGAQGGGHNYQQGSVYKDTYMSTPNEAARNAGAPGSTQQTSYRRAGHMPELTDSDGNRVVIVTTGGSTSAPVPQAKPPDKFSNATPTRSAMGFLMEYKNFVELTQPNAQHLHAGIMWGYLGGKAGSWFRNNVMGKTIAEDRTAVYAEFLRIFGKETPEIILKGYRNRKQQKGESVTDYITDMTGLLNNTDLEDSQKLDLLKSGLTASVQNIIRLETGLKSFDDIEAAALRVEMTIEAAKQGLNPTLNTMNDQQQGSGQQQQQNNGNREGDRRQNNGYPNNRPSNGDRRNSRRDRYDNNGGQQDNCRGADVLPREVIEPYRLTRRVYCITALTL